MLVLIFSWVLIIILLLISIILLSTVKVSIDKLKISNIDNTNTILEKIKFDYEFSISLYFLNLVPYLKINLDREKLEKYNLKKDLNDLNLYRLKKDFSIIKGDLKKLDLKLEKFKMKLFIGTEDVLLTTGLIFIISTIIPNVLNKVIKDFDVKKHKYEIRPLYGNKNLFKLNLNCIINTKMVHIIHVIYIFLKKKRSEVNYDRTSNRRAYDNSYE